MVGSLLDYVEHQPVAGRQWSTMYSDSTLFCKSLGATGILLLFYF